jgi:hypothetical protein
VHRGAFFDEWKSTLQRIGIERGDMVYVASDATYLLAAARKRWGTQEPFDREEFLHSFVDDLQNAVGDAGTLLFPVFTWRFCRGEAFDQRKTTGEVGALNNWVLANRRDFRRTRHPMYSFMVWGRGAEELLALDNVDAWDEKSPFAYLHTHGGKMLLVNVSLQRAFTFMHYVERSIKVPYRYLKSFRGNYTDENGCTEERSYVLYVRDLAIISEEKLSDAMLEGPGAMVSGEWSGGILKSIDLSHAYDIVKDDLLNCGGGQCYRFENYQIDWMRGATHEDDLGH